MALRSRAYILDLESLERKLLLSEGSHRLAVLTPNGHRSAVVRPTQSSVSATAAQPMSLTGQFTGVTDPSIIKQGDTYYIFSTGPGIPIRTSTDLVHWQWIGQVFPGIPAWASSMIPGTPSSGRLTLCILMASITSTTRSRHLGAIGR